MPVFSTYRDGVLKITVDGDYTSEELCRVGDAALDEHAGDGSLPVLFDLSGAAGMQSPSIADLSDAARFFVERRDRMSRVAVVAPSDMAYGLMRMGSASAKVKGLEVEPFRTHAEARSWLAE